MAVRKTPGKHNGDKSEEEKKESQKKKKKNLNWQQSFRIPEVDIVSPTKTTGSEFRHTKPNPDSFAAKTWSVGGEREGLSSWGRRFSTWIFTRPPTTKRPGGLLSEEKGFVVTRETFASAHLLLLLRRKCAGFVLPALLA